MLKTQKKWVRATSLVLSIVLLMGILPMQSFAAGLKESAWYLQKTLEESMPEAEEKKVAPVVGEAEEKRTASEKHFRLADGTFAAAIYETPVHYQNESGAWEQIDNTLVKAQDTQQRAVYENKDSSMKVQFAENSGTGELVQLQNEKGSLSWSFVQKGRSAGSGSPFEVQGQAMQRSAATNPAESDMAVDNITSQGIYRDIVPDVDLQYIIQSNTVKENIILHKKGTANSYTLALKHEGLALRQEADGSITFYKEGETEETAFVFAAPFAYDANGVYTDQAAFTIEEQEGTSLLTVTVDEEWLKAEDRAYPVIIDPYTKPEQREENIQDTYVSQLKPNMNMGQNGSFLVGKNYDYGVNRGLVKFKQLPKLEEGSIIYDAYLDLVQYEFSANDGKPFNVAAYAPQSDWNDRVTWTNQPGADAKALDYVEVKKEIAYRRLDITKLVRQWYNTGANYGVMLKSMVEDKFAVCRMFSSNYPYNQPGNYEGGSQYYPGGVFCYKNATGLEDYWSYHQQSAGTAGTGHTNDFNGNLTMVHEDTATSDPLMSVAVSHVYNLTLRDNAGRFGNGWNLSVMQQFVSTTGELAKDFPCYYQDGDGTKHYFYNDNGTYKDEDGLGMVYNGIDEGQLRSQITLKDKTVLKFDVWSNLRRVIDPNGNTISYNHGPDSQGNYIGDMTDSSGGIIYFSYTGDEHKSKLARITDEAGRQIRYSYDGIGNLVQITYPDGTSSNYGYDGTKLVWAQSSDGYRVEYQYTTDMLTPRVSKITEKDAAGNAGQQMMMSYRNGCVTVFDDGGEDGNLDTWWDNNTTICNFDTFGRLNDMYDRENNAISAEYCENTSGAQKNRLQNQSKLNKTAENYITNGRVQMPRNDGWYAKEYDSGLPFGASGYSGLGYDDDSCFVVGKRSTFSTAGIAQSFSNLSGGKYTFSAYVKVDETLNLADKKDAGAGVMLEIGDSSGGRSYHYGNYVVKTDPAQENGWQRIVVTADVPSGANSVTAFFGLFNSQGTAFFDNMQLEKAENAGAYNLLNNGGFENSSGTKPHSWNTFTEAGMLELWGDEAKFGGQALVMSGVPGKQNRISQAVNLKSGKEGDVFTLSGWAKGTVPPKGSFRLAAAVIYENHGPIWHSIDFNTNITDWQYGSVTFSTDDNDSTTDLTYVAIHVYLFYENTVNDVRFDGLQLLKDSGQSYVYNDKGDLVNAKDAADSSTFSYDGSSNLKGMTDITGTSFSYSYDSKNNLTNASNSDRLNYKFTYDSKGNALNSTISSSGQEAPAAGQVYYIRQKVSGKYMTNLGHQDTNGAVVGQYAKDYFLDQQWRLESVGGGYYKFVNMYATSRVLDVRAGGTTQDTPLQIWKDEGAQSHYFKLKRLKDGSYLILSKCSNDTMAVNNPGGSTEVVGLTMYNTADEDSVWINNQSWFFEPVNFQTDEPQAGKVYEVRNSSTGQYLDVSNNDSVAGTRMIQCFYNGGQNQRFRLSDAGEGSYYMEPMHAPGMVLTENEQSENGYPRVNIQPKADGDNRQKFRFERNPTTPEYYLTNVASCRRAEVLGGVNTSGASVVTTPAGAGGSTTGWVLKECTGEVIQSSSTYVSGTNKIATQTDARGNVTTSQYTGDKRLVSSVTAGGNTTSYSYDANTDRLTSVSGGGENQVQNNYSYEKGKLSAIGHNGFNYGFAYDGFGNMTKTAVGSQTLVANSYNNQRGLLTRSDYGNGGWLNYTYNKVGNLTQKTLDSGDNYVYTYDSRQNLTQTVNTTNSKTTNYLYDFIGRPLRVTSGNHTMNVAYDSKNRVSRFSSQVGSLSTQTEYVYGEQNKSQAPSVVYGVKVNGSQAVSYGYDQLIRMNKRTLHTGIPFVTEYGYAPGGGAGQTTTLVDTVRNGSDELRYTYDASGNILTITENGVLKNSYTYDALNQLTEEVDHVTGLHQSYTYDKGGNLVNRATYTQNSATGAKENQSSVGYGYTDQNWKDKLTNYNGQSISYDAIGNPLSYRDGMSFTWQNGRQMKTAGVNGKNLSFAYNDQGIRTQKTVNGVATDYYLNESAIQTQITGDERLDFFYDDTNTLIGFEKYGNTYYYMRDGIGNITGLLDSTGKQVVAYTYDAWGKVLSVTGEAADTIGQQNPFRYKDYYFDTETGLYYLNGRYYDPQVGRFVNADVVDAAQVDLKDTTNKNLYLYCDNNPTSRADSSGHFWHIVIGAVAGATIAAVTSIVTSKMQNQKVEIGSVVVSAVVGAVSGGLAASGVGLLGQVVVNGAVSALESFGTQMIETGSVNIVKMAVDTAMGVGFAAIGGKGSGKSLSTLSRKPFKRTANALVNQGIQTATNTLKKGVTYMNSQIMPKVFFSIGLKSAPGAAFGSFASIRIESYLSKKGFY